jgi:hypothetical protein
VRCKCSNELLHERDLKQLRLPFTLLLSISNILAITTSSLVALVILTALSISPFAVISQSSRLPIGGSLGNSDQSINRGHGTLHRIVMVR